MYVNVYINNKYTQNTHIIYNCTCIIINIYVIIIIIID